MRVASLLAAAAIATTSATALAAPNPFEDYDRGVKLPEPTELPDDSQTSQSDNYRVEAGTWSTGVNFQLAYTNTTNGVLVGGNESNETLFMRLTPEVRYAVVDNIEVGLSLGLLSKLAARENGIASNENNFLFEASGFYHYELGEGFALVPGLGLGFYAGGSNRDLVLPTGAIANESTTTAGFSGTLHLTGAYQPHENWRLRSGLAIGVLAGSESISSQNQTLSSTAVHVGLPFELVYVF